MMWAEISMGFGTFSFGSIQIGGVSYDHGIVIDHGKIRKREKKTSKKFRDDYGHTPLSVEEKIPWKCRRLVISTGAYGSLPMMKEVKLEAERRKIELYLLRTVEAIEILNESGEEANAILHVTC
jgi:hypothetical protein